MIRQALGLAVLGGFVATATADCTVTMQGTLAVDAPVDFSFAPKAALAPWQMMAVTGGFDANADGSRNFACVADARRSDGRVRIAEPKPGVVTCEWTFEPKSDLKLIVLGLMSDLKIADYGGGQLTVDGETMPVQHLGEIRDIRRKGLKRLSLADAQGGKRLDWAFREPVDLHVQYWGGETLSFRILLPSDDGYQSYAAGRRRALTFSLKGAGRLRESRLNPVTVRAGAVVEYAIVGQNVTIGENCRVGAAPEQADPLAWGLAVLAPGCALEAGTTVPPKTMLDKNGAEVAR